MRKKMKAAWFLAALLSAGLAAFPAMAAQDGHRKTAAGSTMTAMEIKYIMNGKRELTASGDI